MKRLLNMSRTLGLAVMAALVGSVFTSCDKDSDAEGRPYYTKFVDINVIHCERVGGVLMIDYTVANKLDSRIEVELFSPSVSDNGGGSYTDAMGVVSIAFGDNEYYHSATAHINAKDTIVGHAKVKEFDPNDKSSSVKLKLSVGITGETLADKPFEQGKIPVIDRRVKEQGVQTNDTCLVYRVTSCTAVDNDVELNFSIVNETGMTLTDFGMGYAYGGGAECYDRQGNNYESSIRFDGGEWYHLAATDRFAAGSMVSGTILVKDVRPSTTEISVNIGVSAKNYIFADDHVRFLAIPIAK